MGSQRPGEAHIRSVAEKMLPRVNAFRKEHGIELVTVDQLVEMFFETGEEFREAVEANERLWKWVDYKLNTED